MSDTQERLKELNKTLSDYDIMSAEYALPYNDVDIGEMYYYAGKFPDALELANELQERVNVLEEALHDIYHLPSHRPEQEYQSYFQRYPDLDNWDVRHNLYEGDTYEDSARYIYPTLMRMIRTIAKQALSARQSGEK